MPQDPLDELYISSNDLYTNTKRKAETLKTLNVAVSLGIIISGTAITVASSIDDADSAKWVSITLGLAVTVGKSISAIFGLEQKATVMKQISVRARTLLRNISDVIKAQATMEPETYRQYLMQYRKEFDELDMSAFSATASSRKTGSGGSSPTSNRSV